jgi:L-malate glycosyltransferase
VKRVTVIQRRLTHYRVPFFESLKAQLATRDIELTLACGEGTPEEEQKGDSGNLPWSRGLVTRYWAGGRLCIQPMADVVRGADMLVVALENKLLCNLFYQFGHRQLRVGLWGHGANLQGNANSLRERYKKTLARRADWWFGYTELSRPLIDRTGFPADRVTVLNNSVDTAEMSRQYAAVSAEDRAAWRRQHAFGTEPVGIFVGSLYAEKRIEFLMEAATAVRQVVPGFQLAILGAGPQQAQVEAFCQQNPWARYLGMRKGVEKVKALAAADVMLNPGLVGLGILDSFVCGVPMLTTDCGLHSPEIAYLHQGHNGVMTSNDLQAYVQAVSGLLRSPELHQRLQFGCLESGQRYTVANMANNFALGVEACMAAPIWRGGH